MQSNCHAINRGEVFRNLQYEKGKDQGDCDSHDECQTVNSMPRYMRLSYKTNDFEWVSGLAVEAIVELMIFIQNYLKCVEIKKPAALKDNNIK